MKKNTLLFGLILSLASAGMLSAQTYQGTEAEQIIPGSQTVVMSKLSASPSFIVLKDENQLSSYGITAWLRNALKMQGADNVSLYEDSKDDLGWGLQRYHQTYNGIPVEGAVYLAHIKNGSVVSVNGEFFNNLEVSTTPSLNEKTALEKALAYMHADIYMWQDKAAEDRLKQGFSNPALTFYPKGELVIAPMKGDYAQHDFRLCYKFDVYAEKPLKREYVYIDAHTGEVVNTQTRIKDAFVTGTANTLYNGTQTITSDNYGAGKYRLRDGTRVEE